MVVLRQEKMICNKTNEKDLLLIM
uniref:Uncharacterized protein n=1 Tax=Physcomitrium patens TaxID=3218 RepID=A0A2K1ILZ1_PHYPA|nr:hypothetical protein PHYPA_026607 [Physcomitrium patens]